MFDYGSDCLRAVPAYLSYIKLSKRKKMRERTVSRESRAVGWCLY